MIAFFPTIYPDELLYSQLARYYAASGYMAYTYAAEDLFASKIVRPDIEFVNAYTTEAWEVITRVHPMETLVMHHTMFPYYGRFLPLERREAAFQALVTMAGNYHNLLPIPQRKGERPRCLRYCPRCVLSDREQYGETYWHRVPQMVGMRICPEHKCFLKDSSVQISGKTSPKLVAAEEVIPLADEVVVSSNDKESQIAAYMVEVFRSDVDLESQVTAGQFLYSRMENTKYRSVRGQQRNIRLYHAEFADYYKDLKENWFTELWQIQKVLTDDRWNFYEICLMGKFLQVSPRNLALMQLPQKSQQQKFDEEVYRLRNLGMKYPEIAKALNASYDTVKAIGEHRYGTYHKAFKPPHKSGSKPKNWQTRDMALLPHVKKAIQTLRGDETTRPKRVTVFAIEKMLNLSSKEITLHLPICFAEIQRFRESQEQYWAREVVWAARLILSSEVSLTWRRMRELTNMRKANLKACVPYLSSYADDDLRREVLLLLGKTDNV